MITFKQAYVFLEFVDTSPYIDLIFRYESALSFGGINVWQNCSAPRAYTVICFGQLNADNVTSSSQVTLTVKSAYLCRKHRDTSWIPGPGRSLGVEMTTCSSTLVLENSVE